MTELPGSLSVLIADDHGISRSGLKHHISQALPACEFFEAADCAEATKKMEAQNCNLVFLDYRMPPGDSLSCCRELCRLYPGTKIIGISMYNDSDTALKMINAGAHGFLSKNASSAEIKEAIQHIFSGKSFITKNLDDNLASILIDKQKSKPALPHWVTDRMITVLKGINSGKTSQQIAGECFTSKKSIDRDRVIIISHVGSRHAAVIIRYAKENGIIE